MALKLAWVWENAEKLKKKKKYKTLTSPPDYLSEALGKSLILNHFSFLICKIREQILTFYCERSIDEAWSRKISGISRVTFGDVEVIISQIQGEIASLEGETGVRSRELLLVFINFIDLVDSLTYMQLYKLLKNLKKGLSWWLSGKEPACQYRRHEFDPWSERVPHASDQWSPRGPQLLTLSSRVRSHDCWNRSALETVLCNERVAPRTATREKPAQQRRPSTVKDK